MPKTVRLRRVIASTPETVDGALLEREGTPAPFEDANLSGEIREDREITPMSVGPDLHIINPKAE
jgi:hypothetical protein